MDEQSDSLVECDGQEVRWMINAQRNIGHGVITVVLIRSMTPRGSGERKVRISRPKRRGHLARSGLEVKPDGVESGRHCL
jgi:hypothetical protein